MRNNTNIKIRENNHYRLHTHYIDNEEILWTLPIKLGSFNEMHEVLERHKLLKENSPVSLKVMKCVYENMPAKGILGTEDITDELNWIFKEG